MECPYCQSQISPDAKECTFCGEAIPSGQYLLEESGVIEPAPSVSGAAPASAPARNSGRYRFARLGDRFIAFVLDTSVLFGIFAVLDAWIFMRWGRIEGMELQLSAAALLTAITLNATVLFLYGWLLEAGCGATLGKVLVGIRVVGTVEPASFSSCAVRNILRIVDGLGFYILGAIVAACSSVRQRIGDLYAHTAVIEENFRIQVKLAAILLLIATLGGTAWAVPRICSVNNPVRPRYFSQVIVRIGKSGTSAYFRIARFTVEVHSSVTP
jgi:uncharacterized RDD family membrane protein YckC